MGEGGGRERERERETFSSSVQFYMRSRVQCALYIYTPGCTWQLKLLISLYLPSTPHTCAHARTHTREFSRLYGLHGLVLTHGHTNRQTHADAHAHAAYSYSPTDEVRCMLAGTMETTQSLITRVCVHTQTHTSSTGIVARLFLECLPCA